MNTSNLPPVAPPVGVTRLMTAHERLRAYGPELAAPAAPKPRKRRAAAPTFAECLPAHEMAVVDAALAVLSKYLSQAPVTRLHGAQAVQNFLTLHLGHEPREHFGVIYLDTRHRLIEFEILFSGTLTQTNVYPREIAVRALALHAGAVVLAHNHPSGDASPSQADLDLTRVLKRTLALIDVDVIDHVVVAHGQAFSMAQNGVL